MTWNPGSSSSCTFYWKSCAKRMGRKPRMFPKAPYASAQVPSGPPKQVTRSPETVSWKKAQPYNRCDITKGPVSNRQAELTPQDINHLDEFAMAWATWSLPGSDLLFAMPSDLDHQSEFSLDPAHQDLPPLVPNICANVPLIPCQESTKVLSQDNSTQVKLLSEAQKIFSLNPKHQEAVLGPLFRPMSPMGSDYLTSIDLDLLSRMIIPPIPIHQILSEPDSNHKTTIVSHLNHHANDILDSNIHGTLKSVKDHWSPVPLEPVHQNKLQPGVGHQTESTRVSSPQITFQVFPFHWETKTRTSKESQENQISPLLDKDVHFGTIEESNNTQSKLVTTPVHHKIPLQGPGSYTLPITHLRPETRTGCDSLANALSTNHQDKAEAMNKNKMQTLKNTEATLCFNHIKSCTIEGKVVIPAITVKDIIISIPQEKIKKDIYKQILLRRMKGAPRRPGRRILASYRVCLACASWIPNGCPHIQGTKDSGQAQLLAIPMPLPGSEGNMGMKFVLQIPHTKKCSIFNITSTACTLSPSCVSSP
ncbi:uncharacterized protein LOC141507029 isoform X2 [Macrotis lagotis]|uniref:uncharacterized protein LOC141507029 isoform X2 n=1 Tax=Macrotis lagotis TaxID=92651 RepID=UPI003D692CF0